MHWIAPSEKDTAATPEKRLWGAIGQFRADYVLANPPFNVNAVDKERLKDFVGPGRRIPLGLLRTDSAICVYLDAKLSEVKRIVADIETQIASLTADRKSLIRECVTGQRRISEADSTSPPQAEVRRAPDRSEPS